MATAKDSASLRAAFQHEVVVWQNLDHPNVTKVIFLLTYPLLADFYTWYFADKSCIVILHLMDVLLYLK